MREVGGQHHFLSAECWRAFENWNSTSSSSPNSLFNNRGASQRTSSPNRVYAETGRAHLQAPITNSLPIHSFTSSKPRIPERNYIRDPNSAADIEFTAPNQRRKMRALRESKLSSLSVSDINAGPIGNRVPWRSTNPLDPEYCVSQAPVLSLTGWAEEKSRGYVVLFDRRVGGGEE